MIQHEISGWQPQHTVWRAKPIAALAACELASLALPSTHSYGYGFQSRAARTKLADSPWLAIPVRNAG